MFEKLRLGHQPDTWMSGEEATRRTAARVRTCAFAGLLCTGLLAGALCLPAAVPASALADATFDDVDYSDVTDNTGDGTVIVNPDDSGSDQGGGDTGDTTPSPAPTLIASRSDIPTLTAGQSTDVAITFENTGDTAVRQPIASFTPSSGLVIVGNASTVQLPDIEAHGKQTVLLTVKALESSSTSAQSLNIETRFSYDAGGSLVQGSAQDSVPIQCLTTSDTDGSDTSGGSSDSGNSGADTSGAVDAGGYDGGYYDSGSYTYDNGSGGTAVQTSTAGTTSKPVPNVIVTNFSYGDGSSAVAAGSTFPLTFSFTNTSTSLAVENLVVSVDTGDQFTISSGTNTFYSASLGASATQQQTLNLKSIAGEKAATGTISISFKYEYVENQERKTASTDIKLTVPVYQPDRFELENPVCADGATVGQEATVTLSYVNKGKSAVSNVAASITGDGITTTKAQQNVGNIESGKSGTIGLAFTPTEEGTLDLTVTIEYETANDETVTKTFPLQVDAYEDTYADMDYDDSYSDMGDYVEEDESFSLEDIPLPVLIGAGVFAVAFVTLIVVAVRRGTKKRKSAQSWDDDDDWDVSAASVPPLAGGTPMYGQAGAQAQAGAQGGSEQTQPMGQAQAAGADATTRLGGTERQAASANATTQLGGAKGLATSADATSQLGDAQAAASGAGATTQLDGARTRTSAQADGAQAPASAQTDTSNAGATEKLASTQAVADTQAPAESQDDSAQPLADAQASADAPSPAAAQPDGDHFPKA